MGDSATGSEAVGPGSEASGEVDGTLPGPLSVYPRTDFVDIHGITTVNAAFEDMAGVVVTLTLDKSARIAAWMAIETESTGGGGGATTGEWALSIAAEVDRWANHRQLAAGGNDIGSVSIVARTVLLPAGVYTIQGRNRRTAGNRTVTSNHAHLLAMVVS